MLVSQVNPGWLKFGTFVVLLPLILLQAAGYRRPIESERSVGFAFGGGVGVLYAVTTISGPPLAVMLSNQGLTKRDFRAALGFIRLAESSFTAVAYAYVGLYSLESLKLIPFILPSIMIGVPIGALIIQRVRPETFRRVCMSFDAWIVGFGLSSLLKELRLVESNLAYLVLVAVGLLDTWLLYRFFTVQLPRAKQADAIAAREEPPLLVVHEHADAPRLHVDALADDRADDFVVLAARAPPESPGHRRRSLRSSPPRRPAARR